MMHPDPTRKLFKGKRLLYMEESMFHWVGRNGAVPAMLPTHDPGAATNGALPLQRMLSAFDGLILSGGVDMAPESYGESPLHPDWAGDAVRDEYDITLLKAAVEQDIPVLGVCRGAQVINVGFGGTLYQDITTQKDGALVHRDQDAYDQNFHDLTVCAGGWLDLLCDGVRTFETNSVHHQGVKDLAPGLVVDAVSTHDAVVESFHLEESAGRFVFGVQWHPEFQDPASSRLLIPADPIMQMFLSRCAR
jgi:putative glutamine amidotransferase